MIERVRFSRFILLILGFLALPSSAQAADPTISLIGPHPAKVTSGYDYMTALYADQDKTILQCGGVLLSGGWVVTAAHCGRIITVVGRRYDLDDTSQGWESAVNQGGCYRHRRYNHKTHANDIELLKLAQPPPGAATIAPVDDADWRKAASNVTVLGYGYSCGAEKVLCAELVPLLSPQECAKAYNEKPHPPKYEPALCTAGPGVYLNDSGGPVVASTSGGLRLVGVISQMGGETKADREMSISYYEPWIKQVMMDNITETHPCDELVPR